MKARIASDVLADFCSAPQKLKLHARKARHGKAPGRDTRLRYAVLRFKHVYIRTTNEDKPLLLSCVILEEGIDVG